MTCLNFIKYVHDTVFQTLKNNAQTMGTVLAIICLQKRWKRA